MSWFRGGAMRPTQAREMPSPRPVGGAEESSWSGKGNDIKPAIDLEYSLSVNEFEVGDKVIWPGTERSLGSGVITKMDGNGNIGVLFDSDGGVTWLSPDMIRKRTLAEKRADDAKVIGESADKVQATLESGGRDYYGGDTVLKFIEDMGLGFSLGNSVKYIARAGKKDVDTKRADLVKARDYLNREIDKLGDEDEG